MTPEGKVKAALKKRVKALGGRLYFVQFLGLRGAPDCYAAFDRAKSIWKNCWIETKAGTGGRLSKQQELRHAELRGARDLVVVIRSLEDIDFNFPLPGAG